MTWWFSNTRFKNNAHKEILGGKDFRVKISSKIACAALFQKFFTYYFIKTLSVNKY